jgi:hypothetical protein
MIDRHFPLSVCVVEEWPSELASHMPVQRPSVKLDKVPRLKVEQRPAKRAKSARPVRGVLSGCVRDSNGVPRVRRSVRLGHVSAALLQAKDAWSTEALPPSLAYLTVLLRQLNEM